MNLTDKNGTTTEFLRLQVFLAHSGIASRRAAEKLICEGRVAVNNVVITTLGTKISSSDAVTVDGKAVETEKTHHYIALNKPPFFLCSSSDPQNRPLAIDLLPGSITERLYNIGRLDYLSSGLIIFTNDGKFASIVGHPGANIEKEYIVEASGFIPQALLDGFSAGIDIEAEHYKCASIEKIDKKIVRIILEEGKNREIRRVFSHFRLHPKYLCRIRIGRINLGDLPEGKTRDLTKTEIEGLRGA